MWHPEVDEQSRADVEKDNKEKKKYFLDGICDISQVIYILGGPFETDQWRLDRKLC